MFMGNFQISLMVKKKIACGPTYFYGHWSDEPLLMAEFLNKILDYNVLESFNIEIENYLITVHICLCWLVTLTKNH